MHGQFDKHRRSGLGLTNLLLRKAFDTGTANELA